MLWRHNLESTTDSLLRNSPPNKTPKSLLLAKFSLALDDQIMTPPSYTWSRIFMDWSANLNAPGNCPQSSIISRLHKQLQLQYWYYKQDLEICWWHQDLQPSNQFLPVQKFASRFRCPLLMEHTKLMDLNIGKCKVVLKKNSNMTTQYIYNTTNRLLDPGQLGGQGSIVSSPSVVRAKAPAAKAFWWV